MPAEVLSPFQRSKILHRFDLLDVDKNGLIEFADFQAVVEVLSENRGWGPEDPRKEKLMTTNKLLWWALHDYCDADEDGSITEEEWLSYHTRALHQARDFDNLIPGFETTIEAFADFIHDLLDADGDGLITSEDYLALSRAHGIEDAEAREIFKQIDTDGDGNLTLDEVNKLVHEFYFSDDPEALGNRFFGEVPSDD